MIAVPSSRARCEPSVTHLTSILGAGALTDARARAVSQRDKALLPWRLQSYSHGAKRNHKHSNT